MWLSTLRPILVACKARVAEKRKAMRKQNKSKGTLDPDEGYSIADSGGDGESVESIVADPDADLRDVIDESNP